jgi:hypothetical protein
MWLKASETASMSPRFSKTWSSTLGQECLAWSVDYCILSCGWFPRVWILCADVSEHCVSSICVGHVNKENFSSCDLWGLNKKNSSCSHDLWRWHRQSVLKHHHIEFRCWGITQKREYNIHNMVKVWNQVWTNLRVLKQSSFHFLKTL